MPRCRGRVGAGTPSASAAHAHCRLPAVTEPRSYTARVIVAVALVVLAYGALHALDIVILVFGAVLVAVTLHTLAQPLVLRLHWPPRLALAAVVLALLVLAALGVGLVGDQVVGQLQALRQVLPQALADLTRWLDTSAIGLALLELWNSIRLDQAAWSRVAGMATLTLSAIGTMALMVVTGIYLAADPLPYRRGLLRLVPHLHRSRVDDALRAAGTGLSRWLMGQGVSMLAVGGLTTAGLWALGVPQALSLGLIAGTLAFVPLVGTLSAAALIVLSAFTQGPQQALYVAVLCVAVQQVEEYLLMPFVHRWAVALPPALGLLAVVIFGTLFGLVGVLLATPLMVVSMILIDKLYVDGVIDEKPARPPPPEPVARGSQRSVAR
jgi:predicted PurR-regulated permease PerM